MALSTREGFKHFYILRYRKKPTVEIFSSRRTIKMLVTLSKRENNKTASKRVTSPLCKINNKIHKTKQTTDKQNEAKEETRKPTRGGSGVKSALLLSYMKLFNWRLLKEKEKITFSKSKLNYIFKLKFNYLNFCVTIFCTFLISLASWVIQTSINSKPTENKNKLKNSKQTKDIIRTRINIVIIRFLWRNQR